MPIIRITSLPFEQETDIAFTLQEVSATLAALFGIDEQHISLSWHYLAPGHYSCGGTVADTQSASHHPLQVEILVPDFNPPENIEKIILSVAEVLAKSVKVSQDNIFIHVQTARSGTVFDGGVIANWEQNREEQTMTDRPKRSGDERRSDDDRRTANDPNSSPEERRSGIERRTGEDRRKENK